VVEARGTTLAARVEANVDEGIQDGDWIVVASPVNLEDGRRLMWWPPQPVAFNLRR
jgi:hypothetical protein